MSAIVGRLARAAAASGQLYTRTASGQRAAAIAYHVLFSLVPFVALFVAVAELALSETAQERLAGWLTGSLPLPDDVEKGVTNVIEDTGAVASLAGIVSLGGLLWAASGMMASIRSAFRAVWGSQAGHPYLRGKLLDLSLVLAAGLLVVSAFGLTLIVQFVTSASTDLITELGGRGDAGTALGRLAQIGGSLGLTFVAFVLVYRVVPQVPTRLRDIAPGALLAAVAFHVSSAGFSIYLAHLADFDDAYGPLGAILAFLLLIYIAAVVLLLGACFAVAWPSSRAVSSQVGPTLPWRRRIESAARGLISRGKRSPG